MRYYLLQTVGHIVGNQVFDESFGHFLVGESQPIDVEFFIIFLYREVAALVNHGNGIILERLHVCQCLCSHSFTRKVGQTKVVVFQQFHKYPSLIRLSKLCIPIGYFIRLNFV